MGGLGLDEAIDLAGDASFPASDPPCWTPTHAGGPAHRQSGEPELLRDVIARIKDDAHALRARAFPARVAFVEERFEEIGLAVKRRPSESANAEVLIVGSEQPATSVILGARHDTDDVMATATLIAVAHALAGSQLPRTVRFVAFGGGPRGSARYLDDLLRSGPTVAAMVAIEAIGAGARRVAFVGGWSARSVTRRATEAFAKGACGVEGAAWHLPPILSSIRSSVAGAFVDREIPAFMVTDGRGPKWRIDDDRIGRTSAALVSVIRELAKVE